VRSDPRRGWTRRRRPSHYGVGVKACRAILLAQALFFFVSVPEHALSQSSSPEQSPITTSDQTAPFLPEENATRLEPVASDQNLPMVERIEEPARGEPAPTGPVDEVKNYLWKAYQRSSNKVDSHGDFTWKDAAAADVWGLSMEEYVIGGMDPDFRELLFTAGRAMDAAGIEWTILSGFRDDFRQSLAVGLRARGGNSFHGGSVATGGYGHGCAADLASVDGLSEDKVWNWLDRYGQQFGLHRPLPGADPAHVQPIPGWRQKAIGLPNERRAAVGFDESKMDASEAASGPSNPILLSEEQLACSRHANPKGVHKGVRPTQAPRNAVSLEHRNHPREKAAHEHSQVASGGHSAQVKGRGVRRSPG
jgi:hypothetical protein